MTVPMVNVREVRVARLPRTAGGRSHKTNPLLPTRWGEGGAQCRMMGSPRSWPELQILLHVCPQCWHQTVSPIGERRRSSCSRNQRFRPTLGLSGHRKTPGDYFSRRAQGTPRPGRPRQVLRAGQVAANPEPPALSAGSASETPFPSSPLNTQPSTINHLVAGRAAHRSLVTAY